MSGFCESLRLLTVTSHYRLEPTLYRVIRSGEGRVVPPIYKPRQCPTDAPTLDLARLNRIGPWVRHILLQNRSSAEIATVLAACPHADNIALWIVHGRCATVAQLLASRPLRRLSIDPSAFFERVAPDHSVPLARALCADDSDGYSADADADAASNSRGRSGAAELTHLEVINASSSWGKWNQLAQLPALTHLALAGVLVNQEFIDHVLEECAALKVLVLFYITMFDLDRLDLVQRDPRVVLLHSARDHLGQWEAGARGKVDFWVTAERRVGQAQEMVKEGKRRFDMHDLVSANGAFNYAWR